MLVKYRPLEEKHENLIDLFNETINSVYLYNLLALTEYNSEQTMQVRGLQGWVLVILCLITVFVNLCYLLVLKFLALRAWCIRKCME
jgi:hypothetical protein